MGGNNMEILKRAVWNELRSTLARWDVLNDMLQRNEVVDKNEYFSVRLKIQSLERQLYSNEASKGV